MATFVVTTSADVANGDVSETDLSLREAIDLANANAGPDRIRFANGIDLITLQDALPSVTESLAIRGGGGSVTIDANARPAQPRRALDFDAAERVVIDGLVITGGRVVWEDGGGVRARDVEVLTLRNTTLQNNLVQGGYDYSAGRVVGSGGGISADGDVTLVRSWVRNNHAPAGSGGGVASSGDVSLLDTTVEGNDSTYGGGIWGTGAVRAEGSLISGNGALGSYPYCAEGGGVSASKFVAVNSTISGNYVGYSTGGVVSGGGISADDVTLRNSTVTGNVVLSNSGGGVSADTIRVRNSLVVGNAALYGPDDVRGTIRSDPLSLVGGDGREVFAETTRIAPGIFAGVLGENGGLTRTWRCGSTGTIPRSAGRTRRPPPPPTSAASPAMRAPTLARSRRRGKGA